LPKKELAHVSALSLNAAEDYFRAVSLNSEKKEQTLQKLFKQTVRQLQDYASFEIQKKATLSILPISVEHQSQKNNAEYFTEQLTLAVRRQNIFCLIERRDLQYITREIGL